MRRSLKDHAGYFEIDHRESPGLTPADVAHLPGAIAVGPGEHFEADVQQCAHCSRTIVLCPQRTRARGYCATCDHYICDHPVCHATCAPVAKLLDQVQNHAAHFVGREDDPAAPQRILLTDKE